MSQSKYNPNIHHRRSIRLKGYDYSKAGLYFVTICIQRRQYLFGDVIDNKMMVNDAGNMIEKWYAGLENKFPHIHCDEHQTMPNHFHCIIENTATVGADLRVCPDADLRGCPDASNNQNISAIESNLRVCPDKNTLGEHDGNILGEHIGSPLHRVVQWFKTMTTNEYIRNVKNNHWTPFDGKLWQRNYYEHIIRNDESYKRIKNYIINNPSNWRSDKFNPCNKHL